MSTTPPAQNAGTCPFPTHGGDEAMGGIMPHHEDTLTPFCWRSIGNPAMIPALGCRLHGLADRPRPLRVVRDARRHGARGERCVLLAGGGEGARAAGRIGLREERHSASDPRAP